MARFMGWFIALRFPERAATLTRKLKLAILALCDRYGRAMQLLLVGLDSEAIAHWVGQQWPNSGMVQKGSIQGHTCSPK